LKVLRFILQMALGIVVPLAIQRWDRRRLSPAQRESAWNTASWGAALYAFGPLSMLGWCWVTRRGWRGIALGVVSTAVVMTLLTGLHYAISWLLGLKP
jgi:hypothetical protein